MEFKKLEIRNDIQSKVQSDLSKQQREFFLHQQMKTIQEELGDVSHDSEIEDMKKRASKKKWNDETFELNAEGATSVYLGQGEGKDFDFIQWAYTAAYKVMN